MLVPWMKSHLSCRSGCCARRRTLTTGNRNIPVGPIPTGKYKLPIEKLRNYFPDGIPDRKIPTEIAYQGNKICLSVFNFPLCIRILLLVSHTGKMVYARFENFFLSRNTDRKINLYRQKFSILCRLIFHFCWCCYWQIINIFLLAVPLLCHVYTQKNFIRLV